MFQSLVRQIWRERECSLQVFRSDRYLGFNRLYPFLPSQPTSGGFFMPCREPGDETIGRRRGSWNAVIKITRLV